MLGVFLLPLYQAAALLGQAGRVSGQEAATLELAAQAALDTFSASFLLALVFFGLHLLLLGALLYRSGSFPRFLGVLLLPGGLGYILDSLTRAVLRMELPEKGTSGDSILRFTRQKSLASLGHKNGFFMTTALDR